MTPAKLRAIGAKLMAHHRFIKRTLRRFGVRQETADAAQEVMMQAFRQWSTYNAATGNLEAWLMGICRRVASNVRRVRRRRPLALMEAPPDRGAELTGLFEARAFLATVPEHVRPMLQALAEHGSVEGAARDLGVDGDRVRVRLVALRKGADVAPLIRRSKRRDK